MMEFWSIAGKAAKTRTKHLVVRGAILSISVGVGSFWTEITPDESTAWAGIAPGGSATWTEIAPNEDTIWTEIEP